MGALIVISGVILVSYYFFVFIAFITGDIKSKKSMKMAIIPLGAFIELIIDKWNALPSGESDKKKEKT